MTPRKGRDGGEGQRAAAEDPAAPAAASAAQRLYGLPLDEFTGERNALARETAKGGDREAAEAIRSLRKPSVAAWALNQLARREGDGVAELVEAGERLREAQRELLAGAGREEFREASRLEQRLLSALARKAVAIAREAGSAAGDALERRVTDTLRAATLDPAVAKMVLSGQLASDHAATGLPGAGVPAAGKGPRPSEQRPGGASRAEQAKASRRRVEELRRAERRLGDARREEQAVRKRSEAAGRKAARLREQAEQLLERLRAAEADQQAAEKALAEAAEDRERLEREAEELRP